MRELADFLLTRIAEDQDDAGRRYNPNWVAKCRAERAIVEHYQEWYAAFEADRVGFARMDQIIALEWVLRRLALPYADHPDYFDDWRP